MTLMEYSGLLDGLMATLIVEIDEKWLEFLRLFSDEIIVRLDQRPIDSRICQLPIAGANGTDGGQCRRQLAMEGESWGGEGDGKGRKGEAGRKNVFFFLNFLFVFI